MSLVSGKCPNCGGEIQIEETKKEGFCLHCGSKIKTKEAVATVKIDNSEQIENFLIIARNALESQNKTEAEIYCNKVLENDPKNYEAFLIKGEAVGWQSTLAKVRFAEAITCYTNAYLNSPDEIKDEVLKKVIKSIEDLSVALINLRGDHFYQFPHGDAGPDFSGSILQILDAIILFINKSGVDYDPRKLEYDLATMSYNYAVNTYNQKVLPTYKGDDNRPNDYEFRNYVDETDNCIRVIESAITLSEGDNENNVARYDFLITLQSAVSDSCSWDYNYTDYGKSWFKSKTLTKEAQDIRKKIIVGYKEKKDFIDPAKRRTRLYWEKHKAEYDELISKKHELQEEIDEITKLKKKKTPIIVIVWIAAVIFMYGSNGFSIAAAVIVHYFINKKHNAEIKVLKAEQNEIIIELEKDRPEVDLEEKKPAKVAKKEEDNTEASKPKAKVETKKDTGSKPKAKTASKKTTPKKSTPTKK